MRSWLTPPTRREPCKQWPGFKVVEGRSNRSIPTRKPSRRRKGSGYRDIYKQSLITITEMEKLLGKSKFPKSWASCH
jgi:hypothetical protein